MREGKCGRHRGRHPKILREVSAWCYKHEALCRVVAKPTTGGGLIGHVAGFNCYDWSSMGLARTPALDLEETADCGLSTVQFADGLAFLANMELPTWTQAVGVNRLALAVSISGASSYQYFHTLPCHVGYSR